MTNRAEKRRDRGFTLVEVVAALVITGVVVTMVAQGFTNGARAVSVSRDRTRAALIARNVLTDVETGSLPYDRGEPRGPSEEEKGYDVEVLSETTDVDRLYLVTVNVFWQEGAREHSCSLTRYLYRPEETTAE